MREAFVHATQHGEYVISWRLRVGSIEQLADDTERVLGYRPKGINSFLGLPIEVCPFDAPNELVTSEGTVRLIATPPSSRERRVRMPSPDGHAPNSDPSSLAIERQW